MTTFSSDVFDTLEHKILKLDACKNIDHLVVREYADCSRHRKIPFAETIRLILTMTSSTLREELFNYFGMSLDTATPSAFVQARNRIKPAAFKKLSEMMNRAYPCTATTFDGYRLIAVDGSDLAISYDKNDSDTYCRQGKYKGCNLFHINAAYDLLNHRYVDMILQGKTKVNEQRAMWQMAEHFPVKKTIFIADRGYPGWNNMEHMKHAGVCFLIRCKDINSYTSILQKFDLPDTEFDTDVETTLTIKQTKEVKAHPQKYRFLSTSSVFDYIDKQYPYYPVHYRVVRFKLDSGDYESIITNLDRNQFPPNRIKELYNLRWGIEKSFRTLKYSAGLKVQHSKRRTSIQQEIWARIVLCNISMIIVHHVSKNKKGHRKWSYIINRTAAIHLIRKALLLTRKGGTAPPDLEALISKELLPVRPGRHNRRNVQPQEFEQFNYRFS
jgi:hypothetical protein